MLDQLRQIAIFAKTVELGSFRAAAKSLRLSPSVVSHHITQLEQSLDSALIYRSTRRLNLTPEGERLYASAKTMVEAVETGLADVSHQKQELSGLLRLTLPAVLAQSTLVESLGSFAQKNPKVKLFLDFSDLRRELIADGFDIAIRMGWLEDSSLKARKLFEVQRCLIASTSYLKDKSVPLTPAELEDWDWIELPQVWQRRTEFHKGSDTISVLLPESRVSVNNAHALSQLTCAGAGLAILPDFLVEAELKSGKLQKVLPDWSAPSVGVYAVWPSNVSKTGLAKHLIDFLVENN